jgi:hypothetical protein
MSHLNGHFYFRFAGAFVAGGGMVRQWKIKLPEWSGAPRARNAAVLGEFERALVGGVIKISGGKTIVGR